MPDFEFSSGKPAGAPAQAVKSSAGPKVQIREADEDLRKGLQSSGFGLQSKAEAGSREPEASFYGFRGRNPISRVAPHVHGHINSGLDVDG